MSNLSKQTDNKKIRTYALTPDISDEFLDLYMSQPEIAIDTELHGLRLFRDEICLVQICDDQGNVSLVKPEGRQAPPKLKQLLTSRQVTKIFHFALSDVAFFKTSLGIEVVPFRCTKIMSKLVRTYTNKHGLKDLSAELLGREMEKEQQQTNWARADLSGKQLEYAANDVLHLVWIYRKLREMIEARQPFSTGVTVHELNEKAQAILPSLADLLIHGYGDKDGGWESTLFVH